MDISRRAEQPAQVGIIGGTGLEGTGIALRLAAAGVTVLIGSRTLERARETARQLRARSGDLPITAGDNADAAGCDIVVLAVPFAHVDATLESVRERFEEGALVIDVTVPVVFEKGEPRFVDVPEASAAEHVRRRLPDHLRLSAALKTLPARLLSELDHPLDCDDFVCGDSPEARARTIELLQVVPGLRAIDVGSLETSRTLERMTILAIDINRRHRIHEARFRIVGL